MPSGSATVNDAPFRSIVIGMEGIQPSVIKDIGRAITYLRDQGDMVILLVEQYLDFANELADAIHVMDRGEIVLAGPVGDLDPDAMRRHLTV